MAKSVWLREFRRRHVFRVAAAYAVVGWLLIQVATQVFPVFHFPDWIDQAVVLLILVGFPIALMLAWAFDATPHGIVRTEDSLPASRRAWRGIVAVGVIGMLFAIVAGAGWWWHHAAPAEPRARLAAEHAANATAAGPGPAPTMVAAAPIPAKSVAVLPFVNESGEKDQQYFSDGLSEDLITTLSQFSGLKVISRDSSFRFRNSQESSAVIGEKLGVAHLLEGSVQRANGEVRISVELVNAADGSTLWSQRYDRPYKDLFGLQDDITGAVAGALKAKLLTTPGAVAQSDRPPTGNLAAWNAYLQGNFYDALQTEADTRKAIDFYNKAVELDPGFARAHASLSMEWTDLASRFLGGSAAQQANAKARVAAEAALKLAPDLAAAHTAHGWLLLNAEFDWRGAEAEFRRALQLAPNDSAAKYNLGRVLATLGLLSQAVTLTRHALVTDPLAAGNYDFLSQYLATLGRFDEAEQAIRQAISLQPAASEFHQQQAIIEVLRGDTPAALAAAQQEPPGPWHDVAMALALQIGPDRAAADAALQTLVDQDTEGSAYQVAEVYAVRRDPDNIFKWLDHAWDNRDAGVQQLHYDPLLLRYKSDPRFAAFCSKVGLPAITGAKALP